jgi:hypothetical protein
VVGPRPSYLSIGIRHVSDLQPVYLLGMDSLDGVGLAAKFSYGHELLYILLYQSIDHRCIFFGHIMVHPIAYLLLDIIYPYTLCSTDDDCSYTSDYCGQCGRVKYSGHLSILLPTCAQHGQPTQYSVLIFVVLQTIVEYSDPKFRTGLDNALLLVTTRNSSGYRLL